MSTHVLELIAILDENHAAVWERLRGSAFTEETSTGLSTVPLSALTSEQQSAVRRECAAGMKVRGLSLAYSDEALQKVLDYESDDVERPMFILDEAQGVLIFRYASASGVGSEYVEWLLEHIEAEVAIEFQPATMLDDFDDDGPERRADGGLDEITEEFRIDD